jgi:CubicO group peptidase (beta-lactamase class C family)
MRDPELDRAANLAVLAGATPGAAVAAAKREGGTWRLGVGAAGSALGLGDSPLFDLASVTKPFVAVAAARLAARGVVSLEMPLGELLPEVVGTPSAEVSLILFLAHRAGLDGHRMLFAPLVRGCAFSLRAALVEAASARRSYALGAAPAAGFAPLYSDLGYVLAGAALERAAGLSLDEIVEREVCGPLGLDAASARQWLERDAAFLARVAPTEVVAFRGGLVRGVVHDENAWALAGHGLAGQAGLFGTEAAVARFGMAVMDAAAGRTPAWLEARHIEPLLTPRIGGSLRAGFDGKSGPTPASGTRSSAETYGHLGFTGTSFWCDPSQERVTVLLSNRVCPTRDNLKIRALRPTVHDALFAWAGGLVSGDQA